MAPQTNLHLTQYRRTILDFFNRNMIKIIPVTFNRRDYRKETGDKETNSK